MSLRLVWALALLVIATTTASAEKTRKAAAGDKRRIVAILDVRVTGVPDQIAAQFQTDLEKQLDSNEYWLAPRARVTELMANSTRWTEGCVVGKCLNEVRVQTGAELVLLAAITGANTSFGYVVSLVRTDTGQIVSQASDRCDVCTVNEALTSATLAALELVTAVPDTLTDETAAANARIARMAATHATTLAKSKRRHRAVAIGTVLTGIVIAGIGSALYYVADRPTYALATAAAGGGLMVGGVLALNF